jgi:hypothetical protein
VKEKTDDFFCYFLLFALPSEFSSVVRIALQCSSVASIVVKERKAGKLLRLGEISTIRGDAAFVSSTSPLLTQHSTQLWLVGLE